MDCRVMNQRDAIFLSIEEAVEAVCVDLQRYEPQIMVLCRTLSLVLGEGIVLKREGQKCGAWVSMQDRRHMRWMNGPELVGIACAALRSADRDPELMTSVCAGVFHERAWMERDRRTGQVGVRIETGMENFSCRQCGRCCMSLDYHDELTEEDVALWKGLGRTDILEWVRAVHPESGKEAYRIWTVPGTTRLADVCPFLKKIPSQNRWECLIHDVKPAICRQYPLTRKHGLMTGCLGFEIRQG
jgi:Fe-S-cluster containining protein